MRPKKISVSFKKPAHADTVPITCSHCKLKNKLHFGPSDISKQFAKWTCSSCKTELVNLSVQKIGTTANPWEAAQNTIRAKASASQMNYNAKLIGNFARKNWSILIIIAVCLFVWANTSGNGSNSLSKNSRDSSIRSTENVYRDTKIAEQEFIKYSRSERVLIQQFLKDNFGYRSKIDGLWGAKTAESFLRAANRYAKNKSLYSASNVNSVFETALKKQGVTARAQQPSRAQNNQQNNLGLTNEQTATFNYLNNLCWHSTTGPEALAKCSRNSYCQAKFGRNCDVERPQINCVIVEHPFQATSRALNTGINYPDRILCE